MIPGVVMAKASRKNASKSPGGVKAEIAKGSMPRLVTSPTQASTVSFRSVCASMRLVSVMPHQLAADASASTTPMKEISAPGRSISTTPRNPAKVPIQRALLMTSFRIGPASSVVNMTLVKDRTVAVARSRNTKERK